MSAKISIVTGSASGIGKAVYKLLLKNGHSVIGIDVKDADIIADLSNQNGRQQAIERALELSGGKINHIVTSAGLGGHEADKRKILNVNYYGTIEILDGLFDAMKGQEDASAVTIGSNAATFRDFTDNPIVEALMSGEADQAANMIPDDMIPMAYPVSKYALVKAVRERSTKWGEAAVRLNVVVPGQTNTPLYQGVLDHPLLGKNVDNINVPLGRVIAPEEMAEYIELMLGPKMQCLHGSVLWADCGADAAARPDRF